MKDIVAFADLDDTLFQTLRKLPDADPVTLQAATVNTSGEPHSFCTPAQVALLEWLTHGNVTLIPVTGRDEAAMQRVTLPFGSWRVLNHGLSILSPTGEPDPRWADTVHAALLPLQDELQRLSRQIEPLAEALGCRLRSHQAQGLPFMSVIKHPEASAAALAEVQAHWEKSLDSNLGPDSALWVIANANNVSLLPRHLGKAQAVRYLRTHYFAQARLVLGLGDSISDLGFMHECDFALTPSAGQLMRTLRETPLAQR